MAVAAGGSRGGIARAAQQLTQIRSEGRPTFFVDSGDGLFGNATLPELDIGLRLIRAEL